MRRHPVYRNAAGQVIPYMEVVNRVRAAEDALSDGADAELAFVLNLAFTDPENASERISARFAERRRDAIAAVRADIEREAIHGASHIWIDTDWRDRRLSALAIIEAGERPS